MKQIFLMIILAGMSLMPMAAAQPDGQDKALEVLEQKNSSRKAFYGNFKQTKTLVSKKEIKSEGTLYFSAPDKLSMLYTSPEGEKMIINGDTMLNEREGKNNKFDLTKNKSMHTLAATILYSMQGKISELAKICNADINTVQNASGWTVTLTAKTKAAKGYSSIVLAYKSDGTICSMEMTEFSGISTLYEMDSITTGVPDENVFYIRASSHSKRAE